MSKNMDDLFQVGAIANTHGVRGEVKVFPTTDDVKRFSKLKEVLLDTGSEHLTLHVQSVKYFKNLVILKFKEFNNINEVEKYKGKGLFVTRANAVKCEKGEYFIADMIGMQVVTDEDEALGELVDVLQSAANDVYVVSKDGGKELLLPAIKECILKVDIDKQVMTVHMMPGLRDL